MKGQTSDVTKYLIGLFIFYAAIFIIAFIVESSNIGGGIEQFFGKASKVIFDVVKAINPGIEQIAAKRSTIVAGLFIGLIIVILSLFYALLIDNVLKKVFGNNVDDRLLNFLSLLLVIFFTYATISSPIFPFLVATAISAAWVPSLVLVFLVAALGAYMFFRYARLSATVFKEGVIEVDNAWEELKKSVVEEKVDLEKQIKEASNIIKDLKLASEKIEYLKDILGTVTRLNKPVKNEKKFLQEVLRIVQDMEKTIKRDIVLSKVEIKTLTDALKQDNEIREKIREVIVRTKNIPNPEERHLELALKEIIRDERILERVYREIEHEIRELENIYKSFEKIRKKIIYLQAISIDIQKLKEEINNIIQELNRIKEEIDRIPVEQERIREILKRIIAQEEKTIEEIIRKLKI